MQKHTLILGLLAALGFSCAAHAEVSLSFVSEEGDWVGGGQSMTFTDADTNFTYRAQNNGNLISVSLNQNNYEHWFYLDMRAPSGLPLTVGSYEGATRWPFMAFDVPGLNFSGDGRGCNQLGGNFQIHALGYAADGTIEHLDATWEQHCEFRTPALLGEVLIDNRPPMPPLEIALTVDSQATTARNAPTIVTGSITCNVQAEVSLQGTISQQQSRWRVARAEIDGITSCGPEPTQWTTAALNVEGTITKGSAHLMVEALAEDPNHGGLVTTSVNTAISVIVVR